MSEKIAAVKRKIRSTSARYMFAALVLLLAANIIMAVTLIDRAHRNLREQVSKRMLDIGNTAADLLDADFIARMELSDVGSDEYNQAMRTLRIFQENIDLSYIYAVRKMGDGSFVFVIDPDPDDPAPFGFPLEWEEELISASNGIPAVEDSPRSDRWGTFYTAYTPILNDQKQVVGIIGVDYDAGLFGSHFAKDVLTIVIITGAIMILGVVMAVGFARQNRRRYEIVDKEISALDEGFEKLNKSMKESALMKLQERPKSVGNDLLKTLASGEIYDDGLHRRRTDEFTDISMRLQKMQEALKHYISYLDSQTYVDGMTGVCNKLAYRKRIDELDAEIKDKKAQFVVAFFDLNGLRHINAVHGYAVGDTLLYAAATILQRLFEQKNVFHVAGDEFIVILRGRTLTDMDSYFKRISEEADLFNRLKRVPVKLSMSRGSAAYTPGKDENYRQVFLRAEENEKRDKTAYYNTQQSS